MRCSSCIGGRRRSHKRRNDHESASPVKLRKTADSKPSRRMDQHRTVPTCTAYRVESPSGKQEDNNNSTEFDHSDDYRPPSITITELDDETDEENDVESYATSTTTISTYEDTVNPELVSQYHPSAVQSSRAALEVIHEEEFSECSDSETSHILPSSDREIPPTLQDGNITRVDKTSSGHENGTEHVTPTYGPVNVLRDFLHYRQQRKRRRGTALHNTRNGPHFHQNEQQVPTTCLLVDAKESNIAPTVYRSICTTEIVDSEEMQAEVINIGSNSSSLDDLSDMESDNREGIFAQESSTIPDQFSLADQINDSTSTDSTYHLEILKSNNEQPFIVDPSNVTTTSQLPDLQHTNEDVEQTPGVSSNCNSHGDSTQNRAITENQCLKQNILNPSEDSVALAQLHNLSRSQISDSEHVDDIAKGGALAGDVGADQRERHDVVASSIHNVLHAPVEKMSEHRTTLESSEPGTIVVGSTPEHSSASLLVEDRDRASAVVGNDDENVIKTLKDPWSSVIVRDCVPKFDIDCTVNHCVRFGKTPPLVEEIMNRGDKSHGAAAAIALKRENQTLSPPPPPPILAAAQVVPSTAIPLPPPPTKEDANVTNLGQNTVELAEIDKSDTPPPAQLVPLTVEALSSSTAGINALAKNAQAHSGDHPSKTDHADANQNSAQNCVDAVTSVKRPEPSKRTVDDQSALLKYIQVNSRTEDSSEKHYQGNAKNSPNVSPISTANGDCLVGDLKRHQLADPVPVPVRGDASTGEDNVDCAAKIEQAHEDHGRQNCGVSSEVIVLPPNLRNTDHEILVSGTKAGMNNVSRKIPSNTVPSLNLAGDTSPPDRKPTLAGDLRTEISRLKDAELQDEFRKLELEAARFERELQQITVPRQTSQAIECTKNYYVSKQNDFVIERSSISSVNNSNMIGVMHGLGRDNQHQEAAVEIRDQCELRKVQRSNHDTQVMITNSSSADHLHGSGPIPPPPPPSTTSTNPSVDNEEFVVKKVKDRVRDLMASQAAAEATKNEVKIRSAPSTPTASRKNIEAEFKQFREIRQREAIAEMKQQDTKPTVIANSVPAAKQPHAHTGESTERPDGSYNPMRHFSPSRIPLATSKTSSVSHRKHTDTLSKEVTVAKKSNHECKAPPSDDSNSDNIQVNVAALIATHQEKQQLSTLPAVAQVPKIAPPSSNVEHTVPDGNNLAQDDPASAELTVSVSDKCQQFEQRIRQNSTDSACDTITYPRKVCNNSTAVGEQQPFQQKPGTTYGRNGDTKIHLNN
uniref:Uncharacterized protein n=1 Tax=Anopheles culicifacies TaxID=139723 RepID=A0A182MAQ7_9DIPT